jgi:hypothetical protein
VFGVFVGLFFMGLRRHDCFFWGGHFGEIGPFYARFSPEASKRDFLGSEILFLATGAAGDRPPTGLGFGLAARGQGEPGQAAACLGVTHLRGCSGAVRSVDRRRH